LRKLHSHELSKTHLRQLLGTIYSKVAHQKHTHTHTHTHCNFSTSGKLWFIINPKLVKILTTIFIAVPCILKSKVSHSPTDALFITL
jgi:hypothetical protein